MFFPHIILNSKAFLWHTLSYNLTFCLIPYPFLSNQFMDFLYQGSIFYIILYPMVARRYKSSRCSETSFWMHSSKILLANFEEYHQHLKVHAFLSDS